jgi:hypothetical protein
VLFDLFGVIALHQRPRTAKATSAMAGAGGRSHVDAGTLPAMVSVHGRVSAYGVSGQHRRVGRLAKAIDMLELHAA